MWARQGENVPINFSSFLRQPCLWIYTGSKVRQLHELELLAHLPPGPTVCCWQSSGRLQPTVCPGHESRSPWTEGLKSDHVRESHVPEWASQWETARCSDWNPLLSAPELLNDNCKNNPTSKLIQFLHSNLFLVFFSLALHLPSALPKQRDTKKDVRSNHLSVNTRNMQPPFTNSPDVARLLAGSALPELGQAKAYNKARWSSLEKINQVVTSTEPRWNCIAFHRRPRLSKLRTKTITSH